MEHKIIRSLLFLSGIIFVFVFNMIVPSGYGQGATSKQSQLIEYRNPEKDEVVAFDKMSPVDPKGKRIKVSGPIQRARIDPFREVLIEVNSIEFAMQYPSEDIPQLNCYLKAFFSTGTPVLIEAYETDDEFAPSPVISVRKVAPFRKTFRCQPGVSTPEVLSDDRKGTLEPDLDAFSETFGAAFQEYSDGRRIYTSFTGLYPTSDRDAKEVKGTMTSLKWNAAKKQISFTVGGVNLQMWYHRFQPLGYSVKDIQSLVYSGSNVTVFYYEHISHNGIHPVIAIFNSVADGQLVPG